MADLPAATVPPNAFDGFAEQNPSGVFELGGPKTVLVIDDAILKTRIKRALMGAGYLLASRASIATASIVVLHVGAAPAEEVASMRARIRPDAAIVVIGCADGDALASALRAGAVATLPEPLAEEELVRLVGHTLASQAARVQAADLAKQLDLQSHLATIGRLAAGLSHELGSPLTALNGNLEVALEELDAAERGDVRALGRVREVLRETQECAQRMTGLLEIMRDLVRGHVRTLDRTDLDVCVDHVLRRLPPETLKDVQVERIADARVEVLGNTVLLGQVLTNLVTNAAHAARALPSPRIRIHVYPAGSDGVVSVRDNGPGIAPEFQDRIFEPFYTTRRAQGGIGLGLALCREYALQMGARLSLASTPGRGACFRLQLKRAGDNGRDIRGSDGTG